MVQLAKNQVGERGNSFFLLHFFEASTGFWDNEQSIN